MSVKCAKSCVIKQVSEQVQGIVSTLMPSAPLIQQLVSNTSQDWQRLHPAKDGKFKENLNFCNFTPETFQELQLF